MLTDRFLSLANLLLREAEMFTPVAGVGAVESAFVNSISSPSTASAQAFTSAMAQLRERMSAAPSNQLTPSEYEILRAIGGGGLAGNRLVSRIETVLQSQLTGSPSESVVQLQKLRAEVTDFYAAVETARNALVRLGIKPAPPPADGVELGVLIPSVVFRGDLDGIAKELGKLNRHLRTFSEVCGVAPGSPRILSVDSGSVDLYLQCGAVVAACVMTAVERLAGLYKQILEIRLLRQQLSAKGLEPAITDPIERSERSRVDTGIQQLADELLESHAAEVPDEARRNELRTGLVHALRFLADRIDQGVRVETRATLPERATDSQADTTTANSDAGDPVARQGAALIDLPPASVPVLRLPDTETDA